MSITFMKAEIEKFFKSLYNVPGYYFLTDKSGIVLALNREAEEFCKSRKLSSPFLFFDILNKASILKVEFTFHSAFEKSQNLKCEGLLSSTGNDETISMFFFNPISLNYTDIENYMIIFCKDISSEKKIEKELQQFFHVAENTVNPLQITDLSGRMIYVNPAFEKASGYSKEELLGKNPRIFGSKKHSNKFWDEMWTTISSGKVWVGEVENKRKDGEPFFAQLLVSPILDDQKRVTGFFGVHRDLTEKKILEKQLIHTQKMESIGTLAAGVAHEVGNPLASISALVQILQRSTDDRFFKEKLELIKKQIDRISRIIRDLVDFSRPSNYELKLCDINESITEAIEIVKVGTKAKNIDFNVTLDKDIPHLPLIADQAQQVFVNILINAVDAIHDKNIDKTDKEQGNISVKSWADGEQVHIIFSDNGMGISDEDLPKIFEPFFTKKRATKGTGLGLWVSYGIIKSFQGSIRAESKLNKGTTFFIDLPIKH